MHRELDQILAYHCGPALAGLKAANLVSLSTREFPDLTVRVESYGRLFGKRGVHFRVLHTCGEKALLLVYRPHLLRRQLQEPKAAELLHRDGYSAGAELDELLDQLSQRLGSGQDFPHEIGLFLGYPPEDVEGFQCHRGKRCKLCGYWKVYSDVGRAQALFRCYDRCRENLCTRLSRSMSLAEALGAA